MWWLGLNGNRFTGPIPDHLAELTKLVVLNLADNELNGSIPMALGDLNLLDGVYLAGNQLIGCMPDRLTEIKHRDLVPVDLPLCSEAAEWEVSEERGLAHDAEVLLSIRDELMGDGSLNWSVEVPIGEWEGVTVSGDPERVMGIELVAEGLTGTLPRELGELDALRTLRLGHPNYTYESMGTDRGARYYGNSARRAESIARRNSGGTG